MIEKVMGIVEIDMLKYTNVNNLNNNYNYIQINSQKNEKDSKIKK